MIPNPSTGTVRSPRVSQDAVRILRDCRDLAAHRFVLAFSSALDRVSDLLMGRAQRSTDPKEASTLMGARDLLTKHRAQIVSEFETRFRRAVDDRVGGRVERETVPSGGGLELKLLDDAEMEESVVAGNAARAIEGLCESELVPLTRRVGALLGEPELELVGNPLAPTGVFDAFRASWSAACPDVDQRLALLRELSPPVIGDVKSIYADLNRHLVNLNVLPDLAAGFYRRPASPGAKSGPSAEASEEKGAGDLMAALQRVLAKAGGGSAVGKGSALGALRLASGGDPGEVLGSLVSAVGGGVVAVDAPVVSALTRLQQGDSAFDLGDGQVVQLARVAAPKHNVLRDIQDSALGERMNQIDAMTIELVAMLFDFVFVDKNVPDSVKAMIGRLQIPVLKAAMLDRAFFSKKTHPARILVNHLAHAGVGWSPELGHDDPLYQKIESIVARINDEFTDDLALFSRLDEELEQFLDEEERRADTALKSSTDAVDRKDREDIGRIAASAEIERRLLEPLIPTFVINLLRKHWIERLMNIHVEVGDQSAAWMGDLKLLDDLLWSVQPKRMPEERRELTGMLPSLLKRLNPALDSLPWSADERKAFMGHLVQAHAAAVRAMTLPPPSEGEEEVVPAVRVAPEVSLEQDEFAELATSMTRGMWVEFEADDGRLSHAKLAWVSPLRGTLLFTNRQGQQAVSITPYELADRFRANRARPIDAEPLVDRAFSSMMATITEKAGEVAAVGS